MAQDSFSPVSASREDIEAVLGGGGIKGFGHIGLLKAIEKHNIKIGTITGVSIGSAVGAFYTNGFSPDAITEIMLEEFERLSPHGRDRGVQVRKLLRGGLIDLRTLFGDVVRRYKLKPTANLRILAYNVLQRKPYIFEGEHYDLATAIAASCAVPGVMRPVWYGQDDLISVLSTVFKRGRVNPNRAAKGARPAAGEAEAAGIFIDGGVHHPNPDEFCKGPAIISKLGVARELPSEWLSPADLFFHMLEVAASRPLDFLYPDTLKKQHVLVPTGMPNVACLSFGLPPRRCLEMIDYGYTTSSRIFQKEIALGRLPVK